MKSRVAFGLTCMETMRVNIRRLLILGIVVLARPTKARGKLRTPVVQCDCAIARAAVERPACPLGVRARAGCPRRAPTTRSSSLERLAADGDDAAIAAVRAAVRLLRA